MVVDGGQGEEVPAVQYAIEIRDAVEERYEIGERADEADYELCQDGFGNVFGWSGGGVNEEQALRHF